MLYQVMRGREATSSSYACTGSLVITHSLITHKTRYACGSGHSKNQSIRVFACAQAIISRSSSRDHASVFCLFAPNFSCAALKPDLRVWVMGKRSQLRLKGREAETWVANNTIRSRTSKPSPHKLICACITTACAITHSNCPFNRSMGSQEKFLSVVSVRSTSSFTCACVAVSFV